MFLLQRRDFLKSSALAGMGLMLSNSAFSLADDKSEEFPAEALRFRQVHLDYHTSEHITGIAEDFDPGEFARTLRDASVNSVTAFGRCHHGYIYHDTRNFPERRHPHLKRNLLKEQIDACHKVNIRVPVYVTVQWDYYTATRHPEWLMRDASGAPYGGGGEPDTFAPGFYNHLCVATPYYDFLKAYIKDLFESVPVDGLFLDIHHVRANANRECIEGMLRKGLDPSIESVRLEYYREVLAEYRSDLSAFVRKLDPKCSVFYNSGHIGPYIRPLMNTYSHLELESLPSGGWGYIHFPLTSRYARTLGKDVLGMTGKFHTSWGDFHSLKNEAALDFEVNMMLALNAKCSIGDQLHPRGRLDAATYKLIGNAYRGVAEKEPWCEGAKAVTDIAVLSAEEFAQDLRTPEMMTGAVKILQEGAHQFDVVDSASDFAPYRLLILPDTIPVDDKLAAKLKQYLGRGGAVVASWKSGLTPSGDAFALTEWGADYVGEAPYSPDFIVTRGRIAEGLPETELVMYKKGIQVKASSGSTVLAEVNEPYFNRTWQHFSSHRHTPSAGKRGYPGIIQKGKLIYFMHPVFSQYAANAPLWCKKLVLNAIAVLLPDPVVKHKGPSSIIATLNTQERKKRRVLHVLHYVPQRVGADFDTVENVIPLYNIPLSVREDTVVTSVTLVPQRKKLGFRKTGGRIEVTLPVVSGHQMIEFS